MSAGPALLVAVETGSDSIPAGAAPQPPTFANVHALAKLHARLEQHGARPTYLVTKPVARDPRSAEMLRFLLLRGTCEIGAYCGGTAPAGACGSRPQAEGAPADRFARRLATLTGAIAEAVGHRPVTFRAAPPGLASESGAVAVLEQERYLVDASVPPVLLTPYFLAYDSTARAGSSTVLEVPCSAASIRWRRAGPLGNRRLAGGLSRIFSRARLLRLDPSCASLDDMIELADRLVYCGEPVLAVLCRSRDHIADGTRSDTSDAPDALSERLGRFLDYAHRTLKARPATYREFRDAYADGRASAPV